jgi:hypothetical protein
MGLVVYEHLQVPVGPGIIPQAGHWSPEICWERNVILSDCFLLLPSFVRFGDIAGGRSR